MRREPRREGAVPRGGALQGLGLLLDRLRQGIAQGRIEGRRRRRRHRKEQRLDGEEGAREGLRLGRQEDRRSGLSDAHSRRSPTVHPGAYGRPLGGGSGAERPVNIAIVPTLSSEPKMTDWPSALPGSPPSRQWSAWPVSALK